MVMAFAIGAAMSLALLTNVGSQLMLRIRQAGAADRSIRRVLGVATLATVFALASGWDRLLFARGGVFDTNRVESGLVRRLAANEAPQVNAGMSLDEFANARTARSPHITLATDDAPLPGFDGATEWLNSTPLTPSSLRGKVVLVDFWTFACYNCLNALPHVKELYAKYKDRGFVVVGVHTPELAHERILANVRREVSRLGITYPVVIDNDSRIWRAYQNQYWPAAYFADASGRLRFHQFGEGRYDEQDAVVGKLLDERDAALGAAGGKR